jgi:hypothetical protein
VSILRIYTAVIRLDTLDIEAMEEEGEEGVEEVGDEEEDGG